MTVAHPNEQIKFLEYLIEMPEDSTQEIGLIQQPLEIKVMTR